MTNEVIEKLLSIDPYSLSQNEKEKLLLPRLEELTRHHYLKNEEYKNIVNRVFGGIEKIDFKNIEGLPFLPVSLFKSYELSSIPEENVIKTLTSSGTTGQSVSKIFLDKETAEIQAKVLIKIVQSFIGNKRLPMVILDHKSVLKNRASYSARGAGIMGMMQFGYKPFYALQDDMTIDLEGLESYLSEVEDDSPVLFFGFTFMVWKYFILELERAKKKFNIKNGFLVHSGGWKKLQELSVDNKEFKKRVESSVGIKNTINFYGMVEQVGSVYFENSLGYLQVPIYSDVIIRDPVTLKALPEGEKGLIQVVSTLPTSYPGHSLLTEDIGILRGVDNEKLGMSGKYFEIIGRAPKAELRGCSDTFQKEKVA